MLFGGQLGSRFGAQDRCVFRSNFLRACRGKGLCRVPPSRHMPGHHAAASSIALKADFLEEPRGVVTAFLPSPLRFSFDLERLTDPPLRTSLMVQPDNLSVAV